MITPVQLAVLKERFPGIGEPTLRRNAEALLSQPFLAVLPPSITAPAQKPATASIAAKAKRPRVSRVPKTEAPALFFAALASAGLSEPLREHMFHATRKWRFDYAWPQYLIALEVDGGIWVNGGHNRGAQMLKTWEKENEAVCMGWRILRCQPKDLTAAATINSLKRVLTSTPQPP